MQAPEGEERIFLCHVPHVAMMPGWFFPVLFLLVMAGVTAGGLRFNWRNERTGALHASRLVHMRASFAINTIGFLMLK